MALNNALADMGYDGAAMIPHGFRAIARTIERIVSVRRNVRLERMVGIVPSGASSVPPTLQSHGTALQQPDTRPRKRCTQAVRFATRLPRRHAR